MATQDPQMPALEERFLEPPGWEWGSFVREERSVRFGHVQPADKKPSGIVVCLPGLSEFCEKYFEIARNCLDMNLEFWILDWVGQGRSRRYLDNPHKRHSEGFDKDVKDLHHFVSQHIVSSCENTNHDAPPLIMLAHSMGANIGLHYLKSHADMFKCAAFSAPFFGLKIFEHVPAPLSMMATAICHTLAGKSYVPGGRDWTGEDRSDPNQERFSGDPARREIHNAWLRTDRDLQVGSVTYDWVYHAERSCRSLQNPDFLHSIKTPFLITTAGREHFVDNKITKHMVKHLPQAYIVNYPQARHELLMESDAIRGDFLGHFRELLKECDID